MPKYVIEGEIPDAGKLSTTELQWISQTSCGEGRSGADVPTILKTSPVKQVQFDAS